MEGKPVPKLDDRPVLYEDLVYHWNCFWHLNATRRSGFGIERISYSEMSAYMDIHKITDTAQRIRFAERMAYFDSLFLEIHEEMKPAKKFTSREKPHG
jgi:hypothetical protein